MSTRLLRWTTLAAIAFAAWTMGLVSTGTCWADDEAAAPANNTPTEPAKPTRTPANQADAMAPGAFNYYVHPGEAGLLGAELYLAPRPTPQVVGHTYVTYPPLMPHEFLYRHHRKYETYNPGSGLTRTRVKWR